MEFILLLVIFSLIAPAGRNASAGSKEAREKLDRALGEFAGAITGALLVIVNFVISCLNYIKVKRMQYSEEFARKCIMEDLLK